LLKSTIFLSVQINVRWIIKKKQRIQSTLVFRSFFFSLSHFSNHFTCFLVEFHFIKKYSALEKIFNLKKKEITDKTTNLLFAHTHFLCVLTTKASVEFMLWIKITWNYSTKIAKTKKQKISFKKLNKKAKKNLITIIDVGSIGQTQHQQMYLWSEIKFSYFCWGSKIVCMCYIT